MNRKASSVLSSVVFSLFFTVFAAVAQAEVYDLDKAHSTIGFEVSHLTISKVMGSFGEYTGMINFDPKNADQASAEVSIDVNSINTNVEGRDKHLKSKDFFDAEGFPKITFKSSKFVSKGEGAYDIVGTLTIKGVSKEITIPVTISGPITSPMGGGLAIGLSGQTEINRQDYGVTWNKTMDNGGLMVGDNVKIVVNFEAHEKKAEEAPKMEEKK